MKKTVAEERAIYALIMAIHDADQDEKLYKVLADWKEDTERKWRPTDRELAWFNAEIRRQLDRLRTRLQSLRKKTADDNHPARGKV